MQQTGRGTDELAPEGKKQSAKPPGRAEKRRRSDPSVKDASVGRALRSAYQQTVNEAVPRDLLDLLGKLS
jgi:hypothetical protein